MKKSSILVVMIYLLFFTSSLYAQEPGYYIGFGGSYALEDFDSDLLTDDDAMHDPEIGDTWRINTEAGYQFTDCLSLQFDFDYLLNFKSKNTSMVNCSSVNISQKLAIMTFMLSPKFSPNHGSDIARPFLIGGLGVMYAKHDDKASTISPLIRNQNLK